MGILQMVLQYSTSTINMSRLELFLPEQRTYETCKEPNRCNFYEVVWEIEQVKSSINRRLWVLVQPIVVIIKNSLSVNFILTDISEKLTNFDFSLKVLLKLTLQEDFEVWRRKLSEKKWGIRVWRVVSLQPCPEMRF